MEMARRDFAIALAAVARAVVNIEGAAGAGSGAHLGARLLAALAALPPSWALHRSTFRDRGWMSADTGAQTRSAAALHPPGLGAPAAPTR